MNRKIDTTAPRAITLNLPDGDCRRLAVIAGGAAFSKRTFLRWLLELDTIDDFLGHYDLLVEREEDLRADAPVDSPADNRDEIAYRQVCLREVYDSYVRDIWLDTNVLADVRAEPYETALAQVLAWRTQRDELPRAGGNYAVQRDLPM